MSAELAVTVGLLEVSIAQDESAWPDEVKQNFTDKVDALVESLHNEVLEFLQFGEAFDADDE